MLLGEERTIFEDRADAGYRVAKALPGYANREAASGLRWMSLSACKCRNISTRLDRSTKMFDLRNFFIKSGRGSNGAVPSGRAARSPVLARAGSEPLQKGARL